MSFLEEYTDNTPEDILRISKILRKKQYQITKKDIKDINNVTSNYDNVYGFDDPIIRYKKIHSKSRPDDKNIVYKIYTKKKKYIFKGLLLKKKKRLDYIYEIYFNKLFNMLELNRFGFWVPEKKEVFIPGLGLGFICEIVSNMTSNSSKPDLFKKKIKNILYIVDYLICNNDRWCSANEDHVSILDNGSICLIDNAGAHREEVFEKPPRPIKNISKKFLVLFSKLDLSIFDGSYRVNLERQYVKITNMILD